MWEAIECVGLIAYKAIKSFFMGDYTYRASALAFTTLLAIVPLLLVLVSFVSVFPFFMQITLLGENYILQNFIPASAIVIESYFQEFLKQATGLPWVSICFLIVTSLMLVHTIEETFNEIWHVPKRTRHRKMFALLFYWLFFLLIPFIIGLSIFLTSYAFLLSWVSTTEIKSFFKIYFLAALPVFINTMIFSFLYIVVPNTKVGIKAGVFGGLIAALLFEIGRIGFAFYIQQFPGYTIIYGAFAVIPIFLVWLYIFWLIVLFGAYISHIVSCKHDCSQIRKK